MKNIILIPNQKNTNSHGYQKEGRFTSNRPSINVILSKIRPLQQEFTPAIQTTTTRIFYHKYRFHQTSDDANHDIVFFTQSCMCRPYLYRIALKDHTHILKEIPSSTYPGIAE